MAEVSDADLLRAYGRQALERLARWRNLDHRGLNKEGLIELLAAELFDPAAIRHNLAALLPAEHRALEEVQLLGGDAPTALVRQRLEQAGLVEVTLHATRVRPLAATRSAPPPFSDHLTSRAATPSSAPLPFNDVLAGLAARGLVLSFAPEIYGSAVDVNSPGRRLVIPTCVLQQLPPINVPVVAADPPEHVSPGLAKAVLRDVYVVLSAANQAPIPLTTRGLIPKRALVQLNERLQVPEPASEVNPEALSATLAQTSGENDLKRLPLLPSLAEDLGLLVASPGALSATERVPDFLSQPAGERQLQLVGAYRTTTRWCELLHIPDLDIQTGSAGRATPPEVVHARQRVLVHLAELPAERWITLESVVALFKRCAYELLFRRQLPLNPSQAYYEDPYAGNNPLGWTFIHRLSKYPDRDAPSEHWDAVEGGLIELVIEALHWLGVLDLATTAAGLRALRIPAAGNRLLNDEALPDLAVVPNVVVQPNFQIFAFEPIDEAVLFTLDQFAEQVHAERAVEYLLTRDSVYRAQRSGFEASAVIAFLDRVSSVPLAQNVRRSLEEWGALHDRVVVRRAAPLVHTVDAATLDALYADPDIAPLLGRRLAPTAAFAAHSNLAALQARLRATDRLPALSEGRERQPAASYGLAGPTQSALSIDAEGRMELVQRLPDITVLRVIELVADPRPDGSRQITPDSLRRAADAGLGPNEVLAALAPLSAHPLSAELQTLVRRAGKRWGRAALATATLLQVDSPDILAELMQDRDLAPYLHRLQGADCLAVVPRTGLTHVRAALRSRGMDLAAALQEAT